MPPTRRTGVISLADRTERILRAPDAGGDSRAGGIWTPTPDPHTVWDIPPTLQLPTDALGALRAELDRVLTGRPPLSADAYAAQVDLLREQRDLEAGRVDRILTTLLRAEG